MLRRETHRDGARNQMVLSLVNVVTTESYPAESASDFIRPDVAFLSFCGKTRCLLSTLSLVVIYFALQAQLRPTNPFLLINKENNFCIYNITL